MSSVFSWLVRRDRAMRCLAGEEARLHRSIYTAVEPFCSWNKTTDAQSQFGGVYNLEFSPDGYVDRGWRMCELGCANVTTSAVRERVCFVPLLIAQLMRRTYSAIPMCACDLGSILQFLHFQSSYMCDPFSLL